MDKVVTALILSLGTVAMLLVIVCLGTLMGGIAGSIVGFVFSDSIAVAKGLVGAACTNFEFGAAIGFIGGFFRGVVKS